jgi:hypothetical protein
MLTRFFRHAPSRSDVADIPNLPEFPERADLPHLSEQEAETALALLRLLVAQDQATVYTRPYTPEGERPRWNVWDMTAGTGRRVELEPWARGVLAPQIAARGAAREDPASVTDSNDPTVIATTPAHLARFRHGETSRVKCRMDSHPGAEGV